MKQSKIKELKKIYRKIRKKIADKLKEFSEIKKRDDERIFAELVFCILTPQSKAKMCWDAVKRLMEKRLLVSGNTKEIFKELKGIRFRKRKAAFIIFAKKKLAKNNKLTIKKILNKFKDENSAREWFVKNIKGIGWKEASHFLRNIAYASNLAILDRHILKGMKEIGLIKKIPKSLSKKQYLNIEKKFLGFAKKIGINPLHLDFVFWYKATGEIFK